MTQFSFVGDYDAYGQPRKQLAWLCRGAGLPHASDSAEPYLATALETLHAQRDTPQQYMVDRVARAATYEVVNDGRETPFQLWERLQADQATLRLIGLELQLLRR